MAYASTTASQPEAQMHPGSAVVPAPNAFAGLDAACLSPSPSPRGWSCLLPLAVPLPALHHLVAPGRGQRPGGSAALRLWR